MGSSRRVAWLLFAVAWGTNHFVPLLLVYRARLALSSLELAVLFGVYAVGLVPGLLLGGPASDRWGRRAVVLPSSVVALAGTFILAGGAAGFGVLLVGRFVVGLGAGATFTAGTAWIQDLAGGAVAGTGARRAAVALSMGFGTGPLVTGLLAQWLPAPMQLAYAVHAAVLVATIVAVAVADSRRAASTQARVPGPDERPSPSANSPAGRGLPAGFAAVAIVAPWVFVFPSVSHAVLPSLVRAKLGSYAVVFAGVVTGTTLLAGVLVQPVLRTWKPRNASTFGLSMGALGLLCGALAAKGLSPVAVLAAAVLLGTGYGGCLIAGLRFIEANSTSETRGRLTGIYYALTYVGFASPLVLAAVARRVGDVPSLLVALSFCVLTLGVTAIGTAWSSTRPGRT